MPQILLKPTKPIISAALLLLGVAVSIYILFPGSASHVVHHLITLW